MVAASKACSPLTSTSEFHAWPILLPEFKSHLETQFQRDLGNAVYIFPKSKCKNTYQVLIVCDKSQK